MLQGISQQLQNCVLGKIYLDDSDSTKNLIHMAELQSSRRSRSALLSNSEKLAEEGADNPLKNKIGSIWSGICWGAKGAAALVMGKAIHVAYQTKVFQQDNDDFCLSEFGWALGGGVVNAVSGAVGLIPTAFQAATSEKLQALEKIKDSEDIREIWNHLPAFQELLGIASKCFTVLTGFTADEIKIRLAAQCSEFPVTYKIYTTVRDSWNSLTNTHLALAAAGIGAIGFYYNYRNRLEKEGEARERLLKDLTRAYDHASLHLTMIYRDAVQTQNQPKIQECRLLAQKIRANLPLIRSQIAKCGPTLKPDQQRDIVDKIERAIFLA